MELTLKAIVYCAEGGWRWMIVYGDHHAVAVIEQSPNSYLTYTGAILEADAALKIWERDRLGRVIVSSRQQECQIDGDEE